MNFKKKYIDRLFVAENQSNDRGFIAFVVPTNVPPPPKPDLPLEEALTNPAYLGSFVFSAQAPEIADKTAAEKFFQDIEKLTLVSIRFFIWLNDPNQINEDTVSPVQISGDGSSFQTGLNAELTNSLIFQIQSGIKIILDPQKSTLLLDGGSNNFQIGFTGPSAPTMLRVTKGSIPFDGPLRGCTQFAGFIERNSINEDLQCGFQFLVPHLEDNVQPLRSEWLPLIDPTVGPTDNLGFNISIDPSDPLNEVFDPQETNFAEAYASRRTFFNFTGKDFRGEAVTFLSHYRTVFGAPAVFIPRTDNPASNARLVISLGEKESNSLQRFHLCPEGDYLISLPTDKAGNHYLCCGLSGTEFFKVTPQSNGQAGDILRFLARQPAYVPKFPFPTASPVGPPTDPTASPFSKDYLTSWATVLSQSKKTISYVSQPKGAELFGVNKTFEKSFPDLLDHSTLAFQVNPTNTDFFPMFPYTGLQVGQSSMTADEIESLEKTAISPQRRLTIAQISTTNAHLLADGSEKGVIKYDTTPSGLIAKTIQNADGTAVKWDEVNLGWNNDGGKRYSMAFENPPPPLIDALQSSDVFLVAATSEPLGQFANSMSLTSWGMQANVGKGQKYGDYRNVMIIKGRKGKLYDPTTPEKSLVANPEKWTQAGTFANPEMEGDGEKKLDNGVPKNQEQLVILSQWLQDYFEKAHAQGDNEYFSKFNQIASLDRWTGILFLRIDITSLPENLKGLMAGITDPAAFNAHHLGIEISPVKKGAEGPVVDHPSSIFGLIYYVDPDFQDKKPIESIAPSNADFYNFRLLSLKVLFENTTVKRFESYAQLTLNQLFGSTVSKMGDPKNIYKNVLLAGSLQINNGQAVYSLSSQNDDAFYLDNNIINKIEITDVLLSTRSAADAENVVCWFGMSGFIDTFELAYPQGDQEDPKKFNYFDLFSFGNNHGEDQLQKGLNFANLGIQLNFPSDAPSNSTLAFAPAEITFDLTHSTPRENSLYLNLVLDLETLVSGTKEKGPKDLGYLDIIPDYRLGGVSGGDWYGLRFKLNMGSPGELAGKVNLDSYILLSWSPESKGEGSYQAGIGISLPGTGGGAKLISLQNVMKLSIGQIRLKYIEEQQSFLLMFTEIALKFLGLLKIPPNGNTLFYLFGNPKAGGKASGLGWYAKYFIEEKEKQKELTEN